MEYKKGAPTEPGFYFLRIRGEYVHVKKVYSIPGNPALFADAPSFDRIAGPIPYAVDRWRNVEWAGPITEPSN